MTRMCVVTGGGTGIGRAVAAEFAAAGEQVVIVGRRAGVLDEAAAEIAARAPEAPKVRALAADLSDPADVTRVRDALAREFGRVDVLVNNAGGNIELQRPAPDDGLDVMAGRWTDNFRANVLTAVLTTEACADLLADDARVILLSSIAALRGSGAGSYGSVKAALHPYAYDLATRLGPRGITVNVVAPGLIEDTEFFAGNLTEDRRQALIAQTKTGRAGTPADAAATITWLASPAAGHVTAQVIQVNGGAERGR